MEKPNVRPPKGKLAVLLPGMGAVATTTMAGIFLTRRGLAKPFGSLTQLGTIRLSGGGGGGNGNGTAGAGGRRGDDRAPCIRDFLPLASLGALELGGWDIFPDSAYESALNANVLERAHLDAVRDELAAVEPMPGVFYPGFVKRLAGTHVKSGASKLEMVERVRGDIRRFIRDRGCDRAVAVWCGSTEVFATPAPVHASIAAFESGLRENDPSISNSQIYAWACLRERVPYVNGAPHLTLDFPAAEQLAREMRVPVAGKDFKTGQTLMKTVIAPALKARMLGVKGWFSTNILGNRDGEVLDDPGSFKSKEASKMGALDAIFEPEKNPDLYGNIFHKVRIEYYPPRGDAKEGWDNIDLFGWLGYPMQMKIDFLCRDSILAAPLVLDLALLIDLAQRAGLVGTQDWLGFYFKSPMTPAGARPEHDLFAQLGRLENAMRSMMGERLFTHAGGERVDEDVAGIPATPRARSRLA